jgi:carbamoyl-phosphate synthase large subunit
MNVLITSVGRCNRLVRDFRQALPNDGLVFAADASTAAPALRDADRTFVIPRCTDPSYAGRLLEICGEHDVGLLVPRLDREYAVLACERERFLALGTVPVVSDPHILALCEDKAHTNSFLAECGLRTPRTWLSLAEARLALDTRDVSYPVVVKPRFGSTSVGFEEVSDARELALVYELALIRATQRLPNSANVRVEESVLVQERLCGVEYGIDVINDLKGQYVTTFARRKLQMRGGNTDRAVTVDDAQLATLGRTLGERLGHIGCLDCDVFVFPDAAPIVVDLNPRFGGGLLFSHMAGANLAAALVAWRQGETPSPNVLAPRANVQVSKFEDFVVVGDSCREQPL